MAEALTPDECIWALRAQLMHGFGPGTSQETVTAFTRDRRVVGGRLTVVGLEQLAERTTRARGDTTSLLGRLLHAARKSEMALGVVLVVAAQLANILRHHNRRP